MAKFKERDKVQVIRHPDDEIWAVDTTFGRPRYILKNNKRRDPFEEDELHLIPEDAPPTKRGLFGRKK